MIDLIAEYAGKLLIVASPFLLKVLQPQVSVAFANVPAEYREAVASGSFLVVLFLWEARNEANERAGKDAFLDDFLDTMLEPVKDQLGKGLRVNLMVARRWPFLLVKSFHWRASRGFSPGAHRDVGIWLTEFQGVAGAAFRAEEAQWYDLRSVEPFSPSWWPLRNPFLLTRGQYRKTQMVKAILSVPMIRKVGSPTNPRYERVGVLNLDAISDEGAEWLANNRGTIRDELLRACTIMASVA